MARKEAEVTKGEAAEPEVREQLPATVEPQSTAMAVMADYGEEARAGFENNDLRDKMIPFLQILQDLSPQVKQKLVPGAEVGMLINSVTNELWSGTLGKCVFLPCVKQRKYMAWRPRKLGGGLVGAYDESDPVVMEALRKCGGRPQGPMPIKWGEDERTGEKIVTVELVETVYVYGMLMNENGTEFTGPALIPFKSKGLGAWRQWNTAMEGLRNHPPLYAFRTRVFTFEDKGKAGDLFHNWRFAPLGDNWLESLIPPGDPLLLEAREFARQVNAGTVKVDYEGEGHGVGDTTGTGVAAGGGEDDDEAPF